MKIFGTNVSFDKNETVKQRIENLLSAPTVTAADKGYVYFNISQNTFYGWNGISWLDLGASGGGGTPTLDEVLLEGNRSNESIILENTIAASISILDTVSSGRTRISPRSVSTDYTEPDTGTSTMNPVGFHTSGGGSGINSRYAEDEIRYQDDDTTSILYIKPPNPINTGGTISFPDKSGTVALLDDISGGGGAWGSITGTLSDQTDLQTQLDDKASLTLRNTFKGENTFELGFTLLEIPTDKESNIGGTLVYSPDGFKFQPKSLNGGAWWGAFNFGTLNSNQIYTFPNKSGTIALLDDVVTPTLQSTVDTGNKVSGTDVFLYDGSELYVGTPSSSMSAVNQNIRYGKNGLNYLRSNGAGSLSFNMSPGDSTPSGIAIRTSSTTPQDGTQVVIYPTETPERAAVRFGKQSSIQNRRVVIAPALNDDEAVTLGQIQESGTFTPTLMNTSGETYGTQQGYYSRTGNIVHFNLAIQLKSDTNITGNLRIQGLPIAQSSNGVSIFNVTINSSGINYYALTGYGYNNSTYFQIQVKKALNDSMLPLNSGTMLSGTIIYASGTYIID